mmetsp:Transcript_80890/g.187837  ORF Transcript_80890/g.187837 Transcript_80890/m.187837 type:complete len:234 (+) Transcript_80890:504-1205(+)
MHLPSPTILGSMRPQNLWWALPITQPLQQLSKALPLRVRPGAVRRPQPVLHVTTPINSAHSSSTTAPAAGCTSMSAAILSTIGGSSSGAGKGGASDGSGGFSGSAGGGASAGSNSMTAEAMVTSASFSFSSASCSASARPISKSTSFTEPQVFLHIRKRWSEAFMGDNSSRSMIASTCATRVQLPPKSSASMSRLLALSDLLNASRSWPRIERRLSSADGSFTVLPFASTTRL